MPEGDDKNRETVSKSTPLETHRHKDSNLVEFNPDSLDELLTRMRRVRETIPVNHRLRDELKARLLESQAVGAGIPGKPADMAPGLAGSPPGAGSVGHKKRPGLLLLLPAILMVALAWFWWSMTAQKVLEAGPVKEISRFWQEEAPLDYTVLPEGRGYLAVRNGSLQVLDESGSQVGIVKPPRGERLASPALTRDGARLALVRQNETGSAQVLSMAMPGTPIGPGVVRQMEDALSAAQVLVNAEDGRTITDLVWSPDGKTLACALGKPGGQSEVYLVTSNEMASIGTGRRPAWSPDGNRLAVERHSPSGMPELWLVEPGKNEFRLTEGERPAWGPGGHLAFIRVKTTERVLTYSPDGSPLFTVRQRQGEVRTVMINKKDRVQEKSSGYLPGERLLIAPEARPGIDELNWLRQLEFAGVREPRTLLVDQLSSFQGMSFAPDGKSLLMAKWDGSTVLLQKISLRERLSGRGDR